MTRGRTTRRLALLPAALSLAGLGAGVEPAGARQSLDEAIVAQLADGCFQLLEVHTLASLKGNLAKICGGGGQAPAIGASSGGGAATSASAPGILQQKLREQVLSAVASEDTAASADSTSLEVGHGFSLFVLGRGGVVDKARSPFEDGYDSALGGATLGGSYRVGERLVAGLAFDYGHEDGSYDTGGNFKTDSYGLVGFGALGVGPVILEGSAGFAHRVYRHRRRVALIDTQTGEVLPYGRTARGNYDGDAYLVQGSATLVWQWRNLTLTPRSGFVWSRYEYDAYSETGDTGVELRFGKTHQISLLSTLGIGAQAVVSTASFALVPSLEANWLHEFKNDRRTIDVEFADAPPGSPFSYSTESPDRNYGVLRAGLTALLPNGLRPFIGFEALVGNRNYESYLGSVGVSFDL